MKDQEFSSPGREFAPPKPEFARPRAEFAPPGREHAPQGREFEQTSAPSARSKKRRISSLMLTAAAVTTAVVTVSGLGWDDDPKFLLSMEQRAVMNTLTSSLKEMDIDRLIELTENPVLYELISETLTDFFREEAPDYPNHHIESYPHANGGTQTSIGTHFSYDGMYAGLFSHEDLNYHHFDYQTVCPSGSDAPTNTHVRFSLDELPDHHDESPYQSYEFFLNRDETGVLGSWEYRDTIDRDLYVGTDLTGTDHYQVVSTEGTEYYLSYYSSVLELTVKEGSCLSVEGDPVTWEETGVEVFTNYETYLENGTVSTYRNNGDEWVLDNVVVVRDGYSYVDGVRDESSYHQYHF